MGIRILDGKEIRRERMVRIKVSFLSVVARIQNDNSYG
jgi:hypothetical protein